MAIIQSRIVVNADAPALVYRRPLRGNAESAPILVVCDPPTFGAHRSGLPMDVIALKLFARIAFGSGLTKDDFLFVGLCPPMPNEIKNSDSRKWKHVEPHIDDIWDRIETLNPRLIVPLGKEASRVVLGRSVAITKARGKVVEHRDRLVLPCLSPAMILRVPDHEPTFISDIQTIARLKEDDWTVAEQVDASVEYEWREDISDLLENRPTKIAVDTETTGLTWHDPSVEVLTIQITHESGKALVLPVSPNYWNWSGREHLRTQLIQQVRTLLSDPGVKVIGHNLKFDIHMLRKMEIEIANWSDDTQLKAFAVDENMMEKSLDECVRRWVIGMAGYADSFNATVNKADMINVPHDVMLPYAGGDTDATFRLDEELDTLLARDRKQLKCYRLIQMPAMRTFADIVERSGMLVDQDRLREFGAEVNTWLEETYPSLIRRVPPAVRRKHAEAGKELKFSRPDFVRDTLFTPDGFNLEPLVFTKTTRDLKDPSQRVASTSSKDHLPWFADPATVPGQFCLDLIDFQKTNTLSNNFIGSHNEGNGLWQYIAPSGRIYPSYMLHRTATGRTACFTGDTPVYVLDDRGEVPIRDIRPGDWVWSYGDDLKPVPARVSWQGRTIRNAELVRVTYRSGCRKKVKTLRCTPDHRFRLRDGTYVQAKDLQPGDRTLAVERGINHAGYRLFYATGQKVSLEHRAVETAVNGLLDRRLNVHHHNENKVDNRPENLERLTPLEHAQHHPWLPEKIAKREATRKGRSYPKNVNQPPRIQFDPVWAEKELRAAGGRPTVFRDKHGYDYNSAKAALERAGVDWRSIRAEYNSRGELIDGQLVERARQCTRVHDAAHILGVNFYRAREILASDNNHEILSVEVLAEKEDVYDITVPGPHNFIANGVCVHNSADPNGQNFPKRGRWAKAYQSIFTATPGFKLVNCDLSQIELRIAAWMANDPAMLKIYREGGDIHTATAKYVSGLTEQQWNNLDNRARKELRTKAKAVNFGFLYGMGAKKFRAFAKTDYGVDYTEQESYRTRERFFELYQGLEPWHVRTREFVRAHGHVRALHGAVRHLPSIWSNDQSISSGAERQAINSPVQRFGSDLGLMAMARFSAQADPDLYRIIGFVHDALVMEVRDGYEQGGVSALLYAMESNPLEEWFGITPPLPILADAEIGLNGGGLLEFADLPPLEERPEWFLGLGFDTVSAVKPDWWDDQKEEEFAHVHLSL